MARHSVAETKNNLSQLIDRVLAGEEVVITRHGHPVAELKSVTPPALHPTPADIDWLETRRVGRPSPEDAGSLVSRMRDEEWE
jgi:prevent-host-death family protein